MKRSLVSVVMGSDSDVPVMKQCAEMLGFFKIPYEMTIISAHRAPEKTNLYAKNLTKKGIQVVIAGAGGAAHLPAVIASLTVLPVIGVPMKTETLSGVDSLYSIVQMPKGVPVATVSINGAANAAILACEILSLKNAHLTKKLIQYKKNLEREVTKKDLKLKKLGYK